VLSLYTGWDIGGYGQAVRTQEDTVVPDDQDDPAIRLHRADAGRAVAIPSISGIEGRKTRVGLALDRAFTISATKLVASC